MTKRLLVIGGVAAGPKAAVKARRCDPEMEIVIYQDEDDISYAGCGLPYYISGVVKERDELISRTPGKFVVDGIRIQKNRRVERIDTKERTISGKVVESEKTFMDHYDRLVLATGAEPIRPRMDGIELGNVFFLRSIFDADAILELFGLASISTVLEMTNGTADLGEADDKLLVAEPGHGCWGVGKF